MSLILVVDDEPIIRDPIAMALGHAGYRTTCAGDGVEALDAVRQERPDLVLLDLSMPNMDGLSCLRTLRAEPSLSALPVILLTATAEKRLVVEAGRLGVKGYLVKSQFSFKTLLTKVQECLVSTPAKPAAQAAPSPTAPAAGGAAGTTGRRTAPVPGVQVPRLLTKEQTLEQTGQLATTKALGGIAAEVVQLASQPRVGKTELLATLEKDGNFAAGVLELARATAAAAGKPAVATAEEAVDTLGVRAVRDLAASVALFNLFPADGAAAPGLLRCWQHAFGVAALMAQLLPEPDLDVKADEKTTDAPASAADLLGGLPHVAGLCHDLADFVLRHALPEAYATAQQAAAASGRPMREVQAEAFGVPHHELAQHVLTKLALPPTVVQPIVEHFAREARGRAGTVGTVARTLALADLCGNGLMLAASPEAVVAPVATTELRPLLARGTPAMIDGTRVRSTVTTYLTALAHLSPSDAESALRASLAPSGARIWYARHPALSTLDPLYEALARLGGVELHDRLPADAQQFGACDRIVLAAPRHSVSPFSHPELQAMFRWLPRGVPVLHLLGSRDGVNAQGMPPALTVAAYPVSQSTLDAFLRGDHPAAAAA